MNMGALIDVTGKVRSNLLNSVRNFSGSDKKLVTLLKKKIEDCIMEDKSIVIDISSPVMECRNTIFIDDYEVDEERLYLNNGNFEIHINLNESKVEYDNTFDNEFTFVGNNAEIKLAFL